MAYIRRSTDSEEHRELVDAIVQEFINPAPVHAGAERPVIIEESSHGGRFLNVSVIWDAWRDLPGETRGRIIMDAYERNQGTEQALKITAALGLTHEEAKRLNIKVPA